MIDQMNCALYPAVAQNMLSVQLISKHRRAMSTVQRRVNAKLRMLFAGVPWV